MIELRQLLNLDGKFVVEINPRILASDDEIVGVLARESFEIYGLEAEFLANGGRMEAARLFGLVDGRIGTLHSEAWIMQTL